MLQVYKDMKENKTPEWGRKPEWRVMGRVVMDAGNRCMLLQTVLSGRVTVFHPKKNGGCATVYLLRTFYLCWDRDGKGGWKAMVGK